MQLSPVESSNLKAIGYDVETSTLHVEFKNDTLYSYSDVPPEIYSSLTHADSVGKAFNASVKNKFDFTRLR